VIVAALVSLVASPAVILVGNMVEKEIQVFSRDGSTLREAGRLEVSGGPAAVRTAEK
jgi:hypothetical protein